MNSISPNARFVEDLTSSRRSQGLIEGPIYSLRGATAALTLLVDGKRSASATYNAACAHLGQSISRCVNEVWLGLFGAHAIGTTSQVPDECEFREEIDWMDVESSIAICIDYVECLRLIYAAPSENIDGDLAGAVYTLACQIQNLLKDAYKACSGED